MAKLPFQLVYHPGYDLNLGAHVFPSSKFRLIRERLLSDGFADADDFLEPEEASEEELTLVHTHDWVRRLRSGELTPEELLQLEVPYSPEMVQAFFLAAGGSILAARSALENRVAYNTGGGFHHAFPNYGEGFCAIHDVAIAARAMQREGRIERAMVVDCDVHHGNGTASIFRNDEAVFTLSIHQFYNYPAVKPPSDLDIDLEDETGDEEYLSRLLEGYEPAIEKYRPQLVMYVAGADPYYDDQLGGLALTLEGLRRRDDAVIRTALQHGAAVAVTLAGGYARVLEDTVTIQSNTAKSLLDAVTAP